MLDLIARLKFIDLLLHARLLAESLGLEPLVSEPLLLKLLPLRLSLGQVGGLLVRQVLVGL